MNGKTNKSVNVFSIKIRNDNENIYYVYDSVRKSSVKNDISGQILSMFSHEGKEEAYKDDKYQQECMNVIPTSQIFSIEGEVFKNSAADTSTQLNKNVYNGKKKHSLNLRKWLSLFASFVNMFITIGFPINMSVMYVEFLEEFGRSKAETSAVQSVCTGVFFIGGIISGPLVKKYGTKRCGFIGGIMSFVGISASYFATDIIHLVITIGVLGGAGFSLNNVCASTSVSQNFFGRNRFLALSFISVGSGVGGLSFPLLLQFLTTEYNWQGCLLIVSSVVLNLCGCALISGPSVKRDNQIKAANKADVPINNDNGQNSGKSSDDNGQKSGKSNDDNGQNSGKSNDDNGQKSGRSNDDNEQKSGKSNEKGQNSGKSNGNNRQKSSISNTDNEQNSGENSYENRQTLGKSYFGDLFSSFHPLLTNKIFLAYAFAAAITISSINTFLIFFIDFYQFKGFDRETGVLMYSIMTGVGCVFRIFPGFVARSRKVPALAIPSFFSAISAFSFFMLPYSSSLISIGVLVSLSGIAQGGFITVTSVTTLELVGDENYAIGFGFSQGIVGVLNSCAGPISGALRDITGSYDVSVLSAGGSVLCACLMLTVSTIIHEKYYSDKTSRINMELVVRRKSKISNILPWRRSVDFGSIM